MQVKYDFSGKNVILVGGTTGIGRATALAFAKAGANLYVSGIGAEFGQSLKQEVKALGTEIEFEEIDVRDGKAMAKLHQNAFARFGRIDIAFNNAGVPGKTAPVHELEDADYDLLMDVNLRGIFHGLRNQIPHMIANGGGAIVNIASQAGLVALPGESSYCVSKAAVIHMTRVHAVEWGGYGIRVNAVAPTFIETDGTADALADVSFRADTIERIAALHRIGVPTEVSGAVVFLCSPAASLVTGQTLAIDGGWTAR